MAKYTRPKLSAASKWKVPSDWIKIQTIDAHTEGEPLRVIVGGFPDIPGNTILQQRHYAREHFDHLRRALMWEPRGHADMYGCLVTPPVSPGADIGVLFMHNEGYSTMCGHGIIAITKVVLETGLFPMKAPETTLRIDSPAGRITARALVAKGRVTSVRFQNVPSFVLAQDEIVEVPGIGKVRCDIAFGGAFYAYVDAHRAELDSHKFMLNLDGAGRGAEYGGVQLQGDRTELVLPLRKVGRAMGQSFPADNGLSLYSDHFPFMLAGVPAGSYARMDAPATGVTHTGLPLAEMG